MNGDRPNDVKAVIQLIQAGIRDQNLIDCRQFFLDRPQDINLVVDIFRAIKDTKSDFKDYYDFWLSKGATAKDHQSLVQFANAGVKPANLDFILANLPQISDKLAFNYQMLMMRGANPQDQAKQEDLTLLVKFHASGCNNDQIKMMFELLTNKHTNKEL